MAVALASGFADPVFDGQAVFRAVLAALSRPGLPAAIETALSPPAPLTPELAAVALALADPEAPVWLDRVLAASPEVSAFLRFHTGARLVASPAEAAFALVAVSSELPDISALATGSDEYPDRSTTVVLALDGFAGATGIVLAGPGIRDRVTIAPSPLPADFVGRLAANAASFPRGVDYLLVSPGAVLGIPRSTRVIGETA